MNNRFFLSVGSNKGNRLNNIKAAKELICNKNLCKISNCSSIYETKPMYQLKQNNFLNLVLEGYTALNPNKLLDFLKNIELSLGRNLHLAVNSEREIDLDILTYNDVCINSSNLKIPHPKIFERAFVLVPWNDICPNYKLININKTVRNLLSNLKIQDNTIKLYKYKS